MRHDARWQRILVFLTLGILPLLAVTTHEWNVRADGRTHLRFLDIGQGDSELITTPHGYQMLVDGGPDLATLERLGEHFSFFDRSIDLLVLTHPHLDHLASFPEVLERYGVSRVVLTGAGYDSPRYERFLTELHEKHIAIVDPAQHRSIVLDGLTIHLLWPQRRWWGKTAGNIHDSSIVFRLTDGLHSALLTGDLEEKGENVLVAEHLPLRSDLLKVGHHGSHTSSSLAFLRAVHPSLAVVSAGRGNSYGLPNRDILARFASLGIPVRRTDRDGTVEVVWE